MESLRRKRKGSETLVRPDLLRILPSCRKTSSSSHLSLEDCSRQKKKCKEHKQQEETDAATSSKSRLTGVVTAPPLGSSSTDPPGRGLKRKLGCIESATQIGRKKKLEQEYVLGPEIGQGKFGSVRICQSKASGAQFACKTLPKVGDETVHREVEIMQHLSGHPSVVTLQAVYEDRDCFHLVMELCSGGRLLDEMVREGQYAEHRAAILIKELILVIKYCHDMGVVHRDIKPENILLTATGKVKLADFGLAVRVSNGQSLSGVAGSPAYVAPEVLMGHYSEKVDIWGAGVLLHALLVGVLPFHGDTLEDVFEAIKTVKLNFHGGMWESISRPARDLLGRMLTRDVSTRITADEILRHPWIVFYTERTLKTLTIKSKVRNQGGEPSCLTPVRPGLVVERITMSEMPTVESLGRLLSLGSSSQKSEEQEDCGLVDALTAAISCVRISEPKRSRLCGPVNPIQQECSSKMKANLCTAF
ncbi:serine/threonine-protein kinase PEPKR2 [Magnolia sinica]|uniref:serine/threonine-protein kinase PEPKR2 n=1 Tax=Magnolia sinica TaxID=86752 RepID=UPI002657B18F|nr:serine/threonine-protein kinase PEPKR2 [Magnolia sinica]